VWFTLSHGILNEIYYPRIDQACTRDLGFIITDGHSFFSEEKRDAQSTTQPVADGIPAFNVTSVCNEARYQIEKLVFIDPCRDVLLQRVTFEALAGATTDYQLYALLAPHLVNKGAGNTAWIDDYKGASMLFAEGGGTALALGCSIPFAASSAGFVGVSDGWQELRRHFNLHRRYDHARNGNVALTGQVNLAASGGTFILALGFGRTPAEAALRVQISLKENLDATLKEYVAGWRAWHDTLLPLDRTRRQASNRMYRVSTAVLRTHEARNFAGGYIASLSVPWGFAKGDEDLGGYHLTWPRDLVQIAGGLLAVGAKEEVRNIIKYLQGIQEADGHWPQNSWLDGTPYWNGVQLDECAFPILLVDLALREGALSESDLPGLWEMIEKAAGYVVRNGPVTGQDRWEEDGGYSTFTLAVEISALLAAAELADRVASTHLAAYLRETADIWNSLVEHWTYATNTPIARQVGVDGYYVRISPPETADGASPIDGFIPIKNRPPGESSEKASLVVSPDALALVRFGLRAADDPRIRTTVQVIDALVKVDLPAGPCWYRYNNDGYGEHEDGRPYDGTGIGRPWPLLTGERAHYELAAGNKSAARKLLSALEGFANDGQLLPEQVWDAADIPERELFRGRPTGAAMPLAWAHSEHVKLLRSLADGRVFDMPPQPKQRYQVEKVHPLHCLWRFNNKCRRIRAVVHWSVDGWQNVEDTPTKDSGLGTHFADLDTARLKPGDGVVFTLYWPGPDRWEGADYELAVE
jgi:glucoamylase